MSGSSTGWLRSCGRCGGAVGPRRGGVRGALPDRTRGVSRDRDGAARCRDGDGGALVLVETGEPGGTGLDRVGDRDRVVRPGSVAAAWVAGVAGRGAGVPGGGVGSGCGFGGCGAVAGPAGLAERVVCAGKMFGLSLPPLLALGLLMRRGAATDLEGTSWAVGVAAAAWGAFVFVFACPKDDPLYLAVWYLVGVRGSHGCGARAAASGERVVRVTR